MAQVAQVAQVAPVTQVAQVAQVAQAAQAVQAAQAAQVLSQPHERMCEAESFFFDGQWTFMGSSPRAQKAFVEESNGDLKMPVSLRRLEIMENQDN